MVNGQHGTAASQAVVAGLEKY
jgi:serine/threonine protein kinase